MIAHEEFLGPTLRLVAAKGEIHEAEAVSVLSASRPERVGRRDRPEAPSPPADIVGAALRSLKAAGLVEFKTPSLWCVTSEGRSLAESLHGELTFDRLKQYPKYNAYWDSIARDNRRRKNLELRFEHYSSGRLLFMHGSHNAAAVLLAYAIEYHLKAALVEVEPTWTTKERGAVTRRHDLAELYELCLDRGLLTCSFVALEFMEYAQAHFERRYPSGEERILAERGYWSYGGTLIHTYDDCMMQLDAALASAYGSQDYRLFLHALTDTSVPPHLVDSFFHGNAFAVAQLATFRTSLMPARLNIDRHIAEHPELLYFRDGLLPLSVTFESGRALLDWHLAAYFRYPAKGDPDPDPARVLATWDRDRVASFGVTSARWVIDRVVEVFGRGAVELSEDRSARTVFLTVFDRRATQSHRSLVLRNGTTQPFFRNETNESFLEQWIATTRSHFAGSRRKLRIPGR